MTSNERAELIERYRAGAAAVEAAVAGITGAELDRQPAGDGEPEWARRLHYDRPIEPSLAVLTAVRAASLQLLESLSPTEWARTGTHTESGPYSVEGWLRIYAAHPTEHADQIRRARAG